MTRAIQHPAVRAALVLLLGAAVYANALHAPYLFDDFGSIPDNPTIRTLDVRQIFSPPRENTVSARPIANASFALNHAISGDSIAGFHVGNILIHLIAALCLLGLVRRTLLLPVFERRFEDRAATIATIVACLWVVHPLETESVTYLVQRVESIAGMFVLLTLYCSLRAATAPSSAPWMLAAILSCALGMGSKETAAVTPLLVVLYDRAFVFPTLHEALRQRGRFYIPLLLTCGISALLIGQDARHWTAGLHFHGFGSLNYLRIQAGAIVHYLRLIVFPSPLVFDYGEPNDGVPLADSVLQWGPPAALLAFIGLGSLAAWRRHPGWGFLGVSFFVLLGPSSSVVPVTTEVISEHRVYVASALVLIAIVLTVDGALQRHSSLTRGVAAGILTLGAITTLCTLTVRRNRVYGSAVSLWQDTVEHWPGNPRAVLALADAVRAQGDERRYEQLVAGALVLSPTHANAQEKEGEIAEAHGDCPGAVAHYSVALERKPAEADLHYRTANCLVRMGQLDQAVGHYRSALEHAPTDAGCHAAYGSLLARMNRFDEAIDHLRQACRLRPDSPDAPFNLGGVYVRMHRYPDALQAFREATRINPAFALAHERAGIVAGWLGDFAAAEQELSDAVRLDARSADAREDLAWALATRPGAVTADAPRALALAREAVALAPQSRRAWDVLAATEAAGGSCEDAARDVRHAIALPASGYQDSPTAALEKRLAAYSAGQPWRASLLDP
jgi:tetratricopeptide (TPR) repeat protein